MKRINIIISTLLFMLLPSSLWAGGFRYFYHQLTDQEKVIYDAFANCKDLLQVTIDKPLLIPVTGNGTAIVTYGDYESGAWHPKSASIYKGLDAQRVRALDAFTLDDSENYWIAGNDGTINFTFDFVNAANTNSKKSPVRVSIADITAAPFPYYEGIKKEVVAVSSALDKMEDELAGKMSAVKTRYDSLKIIHDAIVTLASYQWKENLPAHTLTGIMLDKYGHKSVCDGYAKLFKLFCDRFDIPCIKVTGVAKTMKFVEKTMVDGPHIWNNVLMEDGSWYIVDVTWDDILTKPKEMTSIEYFLVGSDDLDRFGMTIASHYKSIGVMSSGVPYKHFTLPVVSKKGYKKK